MEWPRATHEFPLTDLEWAIIPAVLQLPINRRILRATLESNFALQSSHGSTLTPDLSLMVVALERAVFGCKDSQILAIVECAFSQDRAVLREKVKRELAARPEIVLVIVIIVNESQDYHGPEEESEAWHVFASEEETQDINSFLSFGQSDVNSTGPGPNLNEEVFTLKPVMVAGHQWCDISSVEYRVWVKGDTSDKIDIGKDKATCGVGDISFLLLLSLMYS